MENTVTGVIMWDRISRTTYGGWDLQVELGGGGESIVGEHGAQRTDSGKVCERNTE